MRSVPFKVTSRATPDGHQRKTDICSWRTSRMHWTRAAPNALLPWPRPLNQRWQCSASALLHMQPTAQQGCLLQQFSGAAS
jgi:hypothetical protein